MARNEKSVTVDASTPEGRAIVRDLARGADILIENFRPGTMERWGLGRDDLGAVDPRLVMVRVTGLGPSSRRTIAAPSTPPAGRAGPSSTR